MKKYFSMEQNLLLKKDKYFYPNSVRELINSEGP